MSITPAAQRLYEYLEKGQGAGVLNLQECQAAVDVVFNLPEDADSEGGLVDRVGEALQTTLTMMSAPQEEWNKLARQIVVRAGLEGETV